MENTSKRNENVPPFIFVLIIKNGANNQLIKVERIQHQSEQTEFFFYKIIRS